MESLKEEFSHLAKMAGILEEAKGVIKEARASFGGEVIDVRDLPDKMQRKVSDIVSDMGLRSHTVEDDLKGQWIYIVFKSICCFKRQFFFKFCFFNHIYRWYYEI